MNSSQVSRSFKSNVIEIFNKLKTEKKANVPRIIPIFSSNNFFGYMRVVSKSYTDDSETIKYLAKWRKQSQNWFPSQFKVTLVGTRKWLIDRLLDTEDRILFIIESPSGKPIGHIGLFRFNFKDQTCEIDNVIRGEKIFPGIMTEATREMISWTKKYLKPKGILLEVFSDNENAISLYQRCGFKEFSRIPLKKIIEKNTISWVEKPGIKSKRYTVYMKLI